MGIISGFCIKSVLKIVTDRNRLKYAWAKVSIHSIQNSYNVIDLFNSIE